MSRGWKGLLKEAGKIIATLRQDFETDCVYRFIDEKAHRL